VIRGGATIISGETLLTANLGYGLRLKSRIGAVQHPLLFDTGTEGAAFIRNCANLAIKLGDIECIAVTHGHWDHMGALIAALDATAADGGRASVHVNPGMFNERGVKLANGKIIPVANVPSPVEMEAHGAVVVNDPKERLPLDGHSYSSGG